MVARALADISLKRHQNVQRRMIVMLCMSVLCALSSPLFAVATATWIPAAPPVFDQETSLHVRSDGEKAAAKIGELKILVNDNKTSYNFVISSDYVENKIQISGIFNNKEDTKNCAIYFEHDFPHIPEKGKGSPAEFASGNAAVTFGNITNMSQKEYTVTFYLVIHTKFSNLAEDAEYILNNDGDGFPAFSIEQINGVGGVGNSESVSIAGGVGTLVDLGANLTLPSGQGGITGNPDSATETPVASVGFFDADGFSLVDTDRVFLPDDLISIIGQPYHFAYAKATIVNASGVDRKYDFDPLKSFRISISHTDLTNSAGTYSIPYSLTVEDYHTTEGLTVSTPLYSADSLSYVLSDLSTHDYDQKKLLFTLPETSRGAYTKAPAGNYSSYITINTVSST